MTPAVTWQSGSASLKLDGELRGATVLLCLEEHHPRHPPSVAVWSVPAARLEDLEAMCTRLRRERDRVPGRLLLSPGGERRAAA